MLYIAVDPGKSIGLTVYEDGKYIFGCTVEDFNWKWLMDKLEELVEGKTDVTVITEEYRIYPAIAVRQSMQPAWSAELNGMLEHFVHIHAKAGKNFRIVRQWAANAKNFASDERLKDFGLWKGDRHQKDSARHLVFYLENEKAGNTSSVRRKVK